MKFNELNLMDNDGLYRAKELVWIVQNGDLIERDGHDSITDCFTLEEIRGMEFEDGVEWEETKVDTPIWFKIFDVSEDTWMRGHFAKFEDGRVYVWTFGLTSHTCLNPSDRDMRDVDYPTLVEPNYKEFEHV